MPRELTPEEIDALPDAPPQRKIAWPLSPEQIDSLPDHPADPPPTISAPDATVRENTVSQHLARIKGIARSLGAGRPSAGIPDGGDFDEAEDPVARAVVGAGRMAGRVAGLGGKALGAATGDVLETYQAAAGAVEPFRNLSAFADQTHPLEYIQGAKFNEDTGRYEEPDKLFKLPYEQETERTKGLERFLRTAAISLAESEPRLAAGFALGAASVPLRVAGQVVGSTAVFPPSIAAGLPMLVTDEGNYDPVGAAIAMGLPGASRMGQEAVTSILSKSPITRVVVESLGNGMAKIKSVTQNVAGIQITNDQFKKFLEHGGGFMAANAYLAAAQGVRNAPELARMTGEQREQFALDIVAQNIAPAVLGFLGHKGSSDTAKQTEPIVQKQFIDMVNELKASGMTQQSVPPGRQLPPPETPAEPPAGPNQPSGPAPVSPPLTQEPNAITTEQQQSRVSVQPQGTPGQRQTPAEAGAGDSLPGPAGQPAGPTPEAQSGQPQPEPKPEVKPSLPATMDTARAIVKMPWQEFQQKASGFNNINLTIGAQATPEEYEELKQLRDQAQVRLDAAKVSAETYRTEGNLNRLGVLSSMPQFYNEAIQAYEEARKAGEPTPGQRDAGNYPKRQVQWNGLNISVENEAGSIRRSHPDAKQPWEVKMPVAYGYIKSTVGRDKDHVDAYLGPDLERSQTVFVLDQQDQETGKLDEHKTFIGFHSREQVIRTYQAAFSDGKANQRVMGIRTMTVDQFKDWLKNGDMKKSVGEWKPTETKPAKVETKAPVAATPRAASDLTGLSESELDAMLDQAAKETAPKRETTPETPTKTASKQPKGRSLRQKSAPKQPAKAEPTDEQLGKIIKTAQGDNSQEEYENQMRGKKPPAEKTPAQIAAEMAKEGVTGMDETVKALHELFGGGKHTGSGPSFSEESYKKAKPHFEKAYEHYKNAGKSLLEFMQSMFEKFGAVIRPYLKRFIQELQAANQRTNVPSSANQPTEGAGGSGRTGDTVPALSGDAGTQEGAGPIPSGANPAVQPGTGQANAGPVAQPGTGSGGEPDANADGVPGGQGAPSPEQAGGETGVPGTGTVRSNPAAPTPAPVPEVGDSGPQNLHFTSPQAPTGLVARAEANIAAIELVKKLEAENRFPTDEERLKLAKWSGWGSFKELFNDGRADRRDYDPGWMKNYGKRYDRLKKLLTPDEFNAAAESSVNAHYTGPDVVVPMWDAARQFGFKGGRVLESSAGSGNFLGYQPEDLAKATQWTAVELEPITGKILAYLYPKADARIQGFESAKIPNGFYEMAIGNVPFHEVGPGKEYPDLNLHNYFIARMLDKVKPGGLVIAITSAGTMENRPQQRAFLASKGQIVGAIRLPSNAFKDSAATEVVTDILVLRKPDGKPFDAQKWENQTNVKIGEEETEFPVNEYFVAHPEMVLGKHSLTGTMYRDKSYTVVGSGELGPKLKQAIERLPADIMQQGESAESVAPTQTQVEDYTLMLDDKGRVMEARGFKLELPSWDSSSAQLVKRAKQYIGLRDVLAGQYELERSKDATEEQIEANRKKLNAEYKAWLKANGTLNLNSRKTDFLRTDPGYFMVLGLENVREIQDPNDPAKTTTVIEPADVLKERVILPDAPPERVENATEALSVSMSYRGAMDMDFMRALTGLSDEQIEAELIGTGAAFKDPESARLVTANEYLSGDVRDKLAKAIFAAKESDLFNRNIEALRAAIPETVPFERIAAGINARWTPLQVINTFAEQIIGLPPGAVSLVPKIEEFVVHPMERWKLGDLARTQWSTEAMTADKLLAHALNMKKAIIKVKVSDDPPKYVTDEDATALANQLIDKIETEYENFIRTTKATVKYRYFHAEQGQYVTEEMGVWDAMEREFNKRFNSFSDPKYDGGMLKLPGLALWVRRTPHLVNGVMRGLMAGSTVYAHSVGSGKTLLGIVLGHEMQRIGLAKKFVHVVKKPTTTQWRISIERAYPGSKILVPNKKDFEAANRKKLIARIASGNWDFIVLSHEQFKSIRPGEQLVKAFYDEQVEQLRQILRDMGAASAENEKSTRGMPPAVRNVVKKIKSLKKALDKHLTATAKHQDIGMPWEQLGVDGLFADESHNWKKMPIPTQIEDVKGIPNDFSQRAVDMLIKVRSVQQRTNGRNIFFASGTPVSNTLAELWVQFHATNPNLLKAFSVETFDSFASAFADVVTNFECGWDGSWKDVTRMSRFKNPAGLTMLTRLGMDVRMGNKELGLDVPELEGGKPIIHTIKPTRAFRRWLVLLDQASADWEALDPKGRFLNSWVPITVMRAGVAAALDPRCVFPDAEDDPNSKVNTAVRDILAEFHRGAERRTTMMVFADMYRTINTEKLMTFIGGHGASQVTEIEASVTPVEPVEGEEAETDAEAAKDEAAFAANAVGSFNLYNDIRAKLVAAGVPEHEIAVVTEHDTDAKRDTLFNKVRSGQVRILLGSTEKIGEGVDVPQRMSAQFHLDPPMQMTPAKVEQRLGRLIRQGNLHSPKNWNLPVRAHLYAQERSMDAAIIQMLQSKGEMTLQAIKGQFLGDTFEDPASELTLAMAEMKAAATGDNRAIELAKLIKVVRELNLEYGAYQRRMSELRRSVDDQSRIARAATQEAANLRRLAAAASAAFPDDKAVTLLHVKSQDRITGAEAITAWLKALEAKMIESAKEPGSKVDISLILGENLRCRASVKHWSHRNSDGTESSRFDHTAIFYLGGPEPEWTDPRWDSSLTTMEGILPALRRLPQTTENRAQTKMEESAKSTRLAEAYTKQFNETTFEKMDQLKEAQAKLEALQSSLRGPQLTPWDKMVREASVQTMPLHLRIMSEMQKLQPQIAQAQQDFYRANLAKSVADRQGNADLSEEAQQAVTAADERVFNLEERMQDLTRRLATVEKARLGAARSGSLANLPYGMTPARGGTTAYSLGEPESLVQEATPEHKAQGIAQLRTLLESDQSGLSAEARRIALEMLKQPVMQDLAWNRLSVAIRNEIPNAAGRAKVLGNADAAQWLMELSKGARPSTFPHEVFHFLFELLPQDYKARVEELRHDAISRAFGFAANEEEAQVVGAFLSELSGPMTSQGFVEMSDRLAAQFPNLDVGPVLRRLYPLINPGEFLASVAGERFTRDNQETRKQGWFDEFIQKIKNWLRGLLDSLQRVLGQKSDIGRIIREMLAGKVMNSPEGGIEAERAMNGEIVLGDEPSAPEDAGIPVANIELGQDVEEALGRDKTRVFGRVDTILGREGIGPAERAAGAAHAKTVFDQSGLQVEQQPNGLWKLVDEGFEQEIEGRKLLQLLKQEIAAQDQPNRAGSNTGYLGNLLNSVVENMTPDRVRAFSESLKQDLYSITQGERSQRGIKLAALGGMSKTVQYVARNIRAVLAKTYSDEFGGAFIRTILDRIATDFRGYFTEQEIQDALTKFPQLANLLDKALALNRRDEGGRVYRRAQNLLKPKGLKTLAMLEGDARVTEAVEAILEQLKREGVEPVPNPNKPLPPLQRLLMMVHPANAEKIQTLIDKAITDAMRNAGIKFALNQAATPEDREDLQGRFAAGEEPTDEQMESGLDLPEFRHWKVLRDNLADYNPVTVRLAQDLVRSDFRGTRFGKPVQRPQDTRLDIEALAKTGESEVDRVLDAYLTNLSANMDVSGATPATRQRILGIVEKLVSDQLEAARARVRGPMFQPPKDLKAVLTPEQRIGQLLNAGLFRDDRLNVAEMVQRVAAKAPIQRLTPKLPELVRQALQVPFYRQSEVSEEFARLTVSELGLSEEQAEPGKAVFREAFEQKFKDAMAKAQKQAQDALTPKERVVAGPKKALWQKIVEATNAGLLDSGVVLQGIARSKGWVIPTEEQVAKLHGLAEQIQRLGELSSAEIVRAGEDPKARRAALDVKLASTHAKRIEVRKQIETMWARFVRPISYRHPWETRRNIAAAMNEFEVANLLLKAFFPIRLATHITTQLAVHIPTRAMGETAARYIADKDSGRETRLWRDLFTTMGGSYADTVRAIVPALQSFRAALAGRAESRNVDRLLGGVQAMDRLSALADEAAARGEYAKAGPLKLLALVRLSLRITQALDNFQGTPAEAQELHLWLVSRLRENGRTPAEAEVAAGQIIGKANDEMPKAAAMVREYMTAAGLNPSNARVIEAARDLVKAWQYERMEGFGLSADDFRARNQLLRRTIAWQERVTTGPGGLVATVGKGMSALMEHAGLPLSFTRFSNAMGTGINYMLMFTPMYAITDVRFPGSQPSPWFTTETDRMQRRAQAILGSIWGALFLMLAAAGAIIVRLAWPADKKERELLEATGHRLGTVEFKAGEGKFIPISLSVGPLSVLAPYLAAGSAINDLLVRRHKEQAKLEEEALKHGLPAGKIRPIDTADVLGVAAAGFERALFQGSKSAVGLTSSVTEYGNFNAKKGVAAYLSPIVPGLPAYQEFARAMGWSMDAKIATVADFMVPLPTSQARAVNLLGDPVGTPDAVQRLVQTMTAGTYPAPVNEAALQQRDAYAALFNSGYRPPSINPDKGYEIDGEWRPMTSAEQVRYTVARGENLKRGLAGMDYADKQMVQSVYEQANETALQTVGASPGAHSMVSSAAGGSIIPATSANRFVPPGMPMPASSGGGQVAGPRGVRVGSSFRRGLGVRRSVGTVRGPSLRRGAPMRAPARTAIPRGGGGSRSLRPRR